MIVSRDLGMVGKACPILHFITYRAVGKCYQTLPLARLITLTLTLIVLDKTSWNCLNSECSYESYIAALVMIVELDMVSLIYPKSLDKILPTKSALDLKFLVLK